MSDKSQGLLAFGVVASASFYRPVTFWAENAWDLSSPIKPLVVGALMATLAYLVYFPIARLTRKPFAVASTLAISILVVMHWTMLNYRLAILVLVVLFGLLSTRLSPHLLRGISYVFIGIFGLAPIAQLVISHIDNSEPYPIVELAPRQDASATGMVEDFLFVVVDGYPSLTIARDWFGHDSSEMAAHLESLNFEVLETGWTQHTFTGISVPSMLELQPVAEPGPTSYGNRSSTFNLIRGDNLVAHVLRSAGFKYVHVEGGWDGQTCGEVDQCFDGPLFDETMFRLLDFSLFGSWLENNLYDYTVDGTIKTVESLKSIQDLFGDGKRDYVFSHLMLPHDPYIMDPECRVLPPSHDTERIDAQFSCVDGLIREIAELAEDSTAVVITGDHGSHTLEQRFIPADQWTDAQVAERFSIFLAYRLPEGCGKPSGPINIEVLRTAVSCAVDIELPANHGKFLIGADNPQWVDPERMERIRAEVAASLIRRP